MNKRGKRAQAAMEFLMTYGWAILIILIVLAGLFAFGVFNPSTENNCKVDLPFICQDLVFREKGFGVSLGANNIESGTINNINVNGQSCSNFNVNGGQNGKVKNGLNKIRCYGVNIKENDKANIEISLDYKTTISRLDHETKLTGNGEVEKSVYSNNFDQSKVLSFNFEEINGNIVKDQSYYSNDGAIINNVNCNVDGKIGKGCEFDGLSNYIDLPKNKFNFGTGDFTIEAWIYPTKEDYGGCGPSALVVFDSTGIWNEWSKNGFTLFYSKGFAYGSPYPSLLNKWIHVVGVRQGDTLSIYEGGIKKDSNSNSDIGAHGVSSGTSASIGRTLCSSIFFKGKIDEFAIYNRALTADEIKKHYEDTK